MCSSKSGSRWSPTPPRPTRPTRLLGCAVLSTTTTERMRTTTQPSVRSPATHPVKASRFTNEMCLMKNILLFLPYMLQNQCCLFTVLLTLLFINWTFSRQGTCPKWTTPFITSSCVPWNTVLWRYSPPFCSWCFARDSFRFLCPFLFLLLCCARLLVFVLIAKFAH